MPTYHDKLKSAANTGMHRQVLHLRQKPATTEMSLHMADGGDVSPYSLRGIGQSISSGVAAIAKPFSTPAGYTPALAAPPLPALAAPPPPPVQLGGMNLSVMQAREKAAGLRDGGELHTGHGGVVPGQGAGDKIPAKYEPGEFVVSNDMLNAQPGLREHLRDLRGNVLAAQGTTSAQADAQAVHGGALHAERGTAGDYQSRVTGRSLVPIDGTLREIPPPPSRSLIPLPGTGDNGYRPNFTAGGSGPAPAPDMGPGNPKVPPGGSAEANAFRASGAATPGGGMPAPVAPAPSTATSLGQKAGALLRSPVFQGASKLVGAASAVGSGTDAVTDAQRGDYAGAAQNSLRSAASIAATSVNPATFLPGVAYLAGDYAGGKIYDNMGRGAQDAVGGTMNEIAKRFGGGVDDSAYLAQNSKLSPVGPNVPAAKPVAAPGAPAVQTDAQRGGNPGVPTLAPSAVDPNALRRVDGGSSPLFTNVADGGLTGNDKLMARGPMSAQNLRAMDGIQGRQDAADAQAARTAQYNKEVSDAAATNAAPVRADTGGLGLRDKATLDVRNASMGSGMTPGDKRRANEQAIAREQNATSRANNQDTARASMYGHEVSREGHVMTNRTALRGQDVTDVGHRLTAETAKGRLAFDLNEKRREQGNADRTYQAGRDDAGIAQSHAADKAWTDHTHTLFPGPDGKPDTAKAAAYTASVDDTVGQMAKQFKNDSDPIKRAYAAKLSKLGKAGLDAEDRAALPMLFERQQLHAATTGVGPFSSGGATSRNLLDYTDAGQTSTLNQNRRKLRGGQEIPESNLRYGADANHFLPNWGSGSNYLGAK